MQLESLKYVRNRFNLPFNDEQLEELPFYRPSENSPELKYLKARREALGVIYRHDAKKAMLWIFQNCQFLIAFYVAVMVNSNLPPW